MIIGEINSLEVKRISDIAYILKDGDEEIFLHKKEALTEHEVGDILNVFIYQDSKKRICASESTPLITLSKPAFLRVVGEKEDVGYFLYDGMPKDLLLSKDDVTFEENEKPQVGDYLFVYLKVQGGFRCKLVAQKLYQEYLKPVGELRVGDFYKCYVVSRKENGVLCYTQDGFEIFVSRGCDRSIHRIGEPLTVEIIQQVSKTKYNGSLLKKKVDQIDADSKKIYEYLKKNRKEVITEEMSPIDIYNIFQMSKAAFKRAVGRLLKLGLIEIISSVIKLKVEEN